MKVFSNHVIFDEITYDRAPLIDWYLRHQHLAVSFGEWMNARSPAGKTAKFRTGTSPITGQTIDLEQLGRLVKDEPEIKPLTELFATSQPFGPYDVDVMIYPPRYVLKAHTDHAMQAGIMFPILPDEPSPINFYHVPPGETLSRAREYDVDHDRDLNYSYNYSTQHPSMFRSQAIHGVRNVQVGRKVPEQRVFLRFKLLYDEFDDIVQRAVNGQWLKLNTHN